MGSKAAWNLYQNSSLLEIDATRPYALAEVQRTQGLSAFSKVLMSEVSKSVRFYHLLANIEAIFFSINRYKLIFFSMNLTKT